MDNTEKQWGERGNWTPDDK